MFKYILQSAGDINLLGLILLIAFFVFFIVISLFVLTKDKKYLNKMSNLPFEDDKKVKGH
jgi:cbb3-type cytochrome oxidase subunit 3